MNIQENLEKLSHSELEFLAELAEDFLFDRDIKLTSHSYRNIITEAVENGFNLPLAIQ
jgi:hypothetical protein